MARMLVMVVKNDGAARSQRGHTVTRDTRAAPAGTARTMLAISKAYRHRTGHRHLTTATDGNKHDTLEQWQDYLLEVI